MTPETKSKFEFYEVVRLRKDKQIPSELVGREAVILGMSVGDDRNWFYAVRIDGHEPCRNVTEQALESTGQFKRREDFYSDQSIKISVDPETGAGEDYSARIMKY